MKSVNADDLFLVGYIGDSFQVKIPGFFGTLPLLLRAEMISAADTPIRACRQGRQRNVTYAVGEAERGRGPI